MKWAAPEVLNHQGVRFESSVYSYAVIVVCWEIVSRQIPWQGGTVNQLLVKVCRGVRPKVPGEAPPLLVLVVQAVLGPLIV